MSRIVSSIPGRIRARDTALRQPERLARLHAALGATAGVLSASANAAAGSLVLHYDAARIPVEDMEAIVEAAVDAELARPKNGLPPSTRVRINRCAKYGMLGSLGISLALAASGQKRWHALSGALFVACLGVHLTVHRRHLLR